MQYLAITIGGATAVGAIFAVYYVMSVSQENEAFTQEFYGYRSTRTLNINFSASDTVVNSQLRLAEEKTKTCLPALLDLRYSKFEFMTGAIDESKSSGCPIAVIIYDIAYDGDEVSSVGSDSFDCLVPLEKLQGWTGWKNAESPGISEIEDNCRKIRTFN